MSTEVSTVAKSVLEVIESHRRGEISASAVALLLALKTEKLPKTWTGEEVSELCFKVVLHLESADFFLNDFHLAWDLLEDGPRTPYASATELADKYRQLALDEIEAALIEC